jgi:hypothetical protein
MAEDPEPPGHSAGPDAIRAAYFRRVRNVGDAIAPLVLERISGRPVMVTSSLQRDHLLSIGSLLQTSTRNSFVWGTGLIHPSVGVGDPDPGRILALRGKLTHAELHRNGVALADVPLGDPGYLIPSIFGVRAATDPRYALGLVPYVFDRDHPFFTAAALHPDVKVLDVCAPPVQFFAELAACATVASSSLHGLVFGEALGLPTLWLEVSGNHAGGRFKFEDWFSLARNPQRVPHTPAAFVSAAELVRRSEPREVEIDTAALLGALRTEAIEACSEPSHRGPPAIPVEECRARPVPVFVGSGAELNAAVRAFYAGWAEPSRYAVADTPASVAALAPDALALYDDVLDRFRRADWVGPLDVPPTESADAPDENARCRCRFVSGAEAVGPALYRAGASIGPATLGLRVCAFHHRNAPRSAFTYDERRALETQPAIIA